VDWPTQLPIGRLPDELPEALPNGDLVLVRGNGPMADVLVLRYADGTEDLPDEDRQLELVTSFSMPGQRFLETCASVLEKFGAS
jgi:hypothetical protein